MAACRRTRMPCLHARVKRDGALAPRPTVLYRSRGIVWRGGREAEGGGSLNRYTAQKLYRGFESLPLRSAQGGPLPPCVAPSALVSAKATASDDGSCSRDRRARELQGAWIDWRHPCPWSLT